MALAERWEQLEPRERTLLTALGGITVLVVVLILPVMLLQNLWAKQDENQEVRDMIARIEEKREKISATRKAQDAVLARYANRAPAVATLVEEAAKENGLTLSETNNNPDVPRGAEYTERHTVTRLRKVGLLPLGRTLEHIAQSKYPVAITKLSIKLFRPDEYEVVLGVSAYDKKGVVPKETKPGKPKGKPSNKKTPATAKPKTSAPPPGLRPSPAPPPPPTR